MSSLNAGRMEKLLKQVYQLYRKEMRDLESELESVKQRMIERHECQRCSQLQKALEQKIEYYEELLLSKDTCKGDLIDNIEYDHSKVDQPLESRERKSTTSRKRTDNLEVLISDEEHSVSDIKSPSLFDGISHVSSSSKLTNSKELFSPVPETPVADMEKTTEYTPTVVLETLDEFNLASTSFNKATPVTYDGSQTPPNLTIEIPPFNKYKETDPTANRIDIQSIPEEVLISPVLSNKEPDIPQIVIEDSVIDELNDSLDDFQPPKPNKRRREDRKCQKTARLKRTAVRGVGWKPSAPSLSSAKYSFEPATVGYRKPKYKQTTLSQTFNENARRNSNARLGNVKHSTQEDLDATYVPTQCLPEALRKTNVDEICQDKVSKELPSISTFYQIDSDSSDSEDLLAKMVWSPKTSTKTLGTNKMPVSVAERPSTSKRLPSNFFDDFDEVPSNTPKPNYKYVRDAVKKKDERRKLDGQQCHECEKYYNNLGLSEGEKKKRLNNCSRHRDKFARPKTPDHFWSVDFPTTQESKNRGIVQETHYRPLQERRLRPGNNIL